MQNISFDLEVNERDLRLELLSGEGNKISVKLNDKVYNLDIVKVENGVYSVLLGNKVYNIELSEQNNHKKYLVSANNDYFDIEVVDAQTKYLRNRDNSLAGGSENTISSPMPGKVVKITTSVGDEVKVGDTLIIVSAMKMESEYKSAIDGVVKEIFVNEDDTIDGNQPLIYVE